MRTFIDGNGMISTTHADRVAAGHGELPDVESYLAAHRQLFPADLYIINTAPCYAGHYLGQQFMLTDYQSRLCWSYKGIFKKAVISRGEVNSKIGLEADTLDITWSPQDADVLDPLLSIFAGFRYGVFRTAAVEVWRSVMPTEGDCDTLGACCMFAGRIGTVALDRLKAKFEVLSRLSLLNAQIPPNTIEATNTLAQYSVGMRPPNGPTFFTVAAGSSQNKVYATGSHAGYTPTDGTYTAGYLVFTSGKLAGHYVRVGQQNMEGGEHAFYCEQMLPLVPQPADTLSAFVYVPPDRAAAMDTGADFVGFPYCPQPQNSAFILG